MSMALQNRDLMAFASQNYTPSTLCVVMCLVRTKLVNFGLQNCIVLQVSLSLQVSLYCDSEISIRIRSNLELLSGRMCVSATL